MQRFVTQLVPTTQLTNATATYFTADSNVIAEIGVVTATNVTGSARTITIYLVPSGGTAGSTNIVVQTKAVPANGAIRVPELEGHKVPAGATIQAKADAGTAVNLSVGGYVVV